MRVYEVEPIIEGLPLTDRNLWEQTRIKVYSTASMFSKNKIHVQDIMSFPWDEDHKQATRDDAPDYDESTVEAIHQRMKEAGEEQIATFLQQRDEEEKRHEIRYLSDK
jgi:hypothetical protein